MRSYNPLTEPIVSTSFQYNIKYLKATLTLVKEVGLARGLCSAKNYALELVTDEILQIINSYAGTLSQPPVTISLYEVAQGVAVRIQYSGPPAEIDLDLEKSKEDEDYSVVLVAGFTDILECKNLGMEGREFYFEIHFNEEQLAQERERQGEQISLPTVVPTFDTSGWCQDDYIMRLIEKDDAIEVSRCIYSTYGYSYPREIVYYPDQFYESHKAGKVQCVVVETPDGVIAGTAIIIRDTGLPGACEIVGLAVKKEYQQLGLAKLLLHFNIEQEIKNNQNLISLFGETVTNHPYSQKAFEREGFDPTGIFFGLIPSDTCFSDFEKEDDTKVTPRISAVYYVKQVAPWQKKALFVAAKDSKIVEQVFSQAGHPVHLITTENVPSTPKSSVSTTFVEKLEVGLIQISMTGEDLLELIQSETFRLKSMGAKVIVIHLNMLDESAAWAREELAPLGYEFTGILPGDSTFHPMMLQYFSGVVFDSEDISLASPVGKEILEHVKNNDKSMSFS